MTKPTDFLDFVVDQLRRWEPAVGVRRMFGGWGIYREGQIFGIVIDDVLYFKSGAENRSDFEAAGMEAFTYSRASGPAVATSYRRVPDDVLEDADALAAWAGKAYAVGLAAAAKPGRARRKH